MDRVWAVAGRVTATVGLLFVVSLLGFGLFYLPLHPHLPATSGLSISALKETSGGGGISQEYLQLNSPPPSLITSYRTWVGGSWLVGLATAILLVSAAATVKPAVQRPVRLAASVMPLL